MMVLGPKYVGAFFNVLMCKFYKFEFIEHAATTPNLYKEINLWLFLVWL